MTDAGQSRLPPRERGEPLRLRGGELRKLDDAPESSPPGMEDGSTAPAASPSRLRVPDRPRSRPRAWLLTGIRYVLPVVVTLCGAVIMAFGSEADLEGGASIVSAGLAIYFLNWLYRIGVRGDRERDTEEEAREYFSRHGRWPS